MPLPVDPPLSPAVRQVFLDVLERLQQTGRARLPLVTGLSGLVIARWLYRGWLARQPRWRPFLHVARRWMTPEATTELLQLAHGGWLYVEQGAPSWLTATGISLLEDADTGPAIELPRETLRQFLRLDHYHLVEVDPALTDIRQSLLSHCRSCSTVHLTGPPGSGKRSLGFWAHATLDNRPLSHIRRGGDRRPAPGQWALYDEVGELESDQLHYLRERLKAQEEPPPPIFEATPETTARPDIPAFRAILGESPALSRVLSRAARAAPGTLPVLILGESGVGKELLARAIHEASGRRGEYVVVDLSSFNEELIESELFGHRRGAYTGAERDRTGAVRRADGGTLFLDELGNLSPRIQAKLLRVIQEKQVQPVGEDRPVRVDVRFVAATNADLESMVRRGEFREDLLRRLDAVPLRLPPLRERPEDILLLARSFLSAERPVGADWISPEGRNILLSFGWPGNVRELMNVMSAAAVESEDGRVEVQHLGPLAPHNRRLVPLLTTSSEEDRSEGWGLERNLVQRMTAVTLRLPPLRDRGTLSLRNAILGLLEGHPIRLEALAALERRPWWGNFPEMMADLRAVRTNVDGPIDLDALRRTLPHLLQREHHQPIKVLLTPTMHPDGSVSGLQEDFHEAALLVGRLRSLAELERLARSGEDAARTRTRLEAVRAKLGTHNAACLHLGHLPRLARPHFIVARDEHGLVVHALPGVGLVLRAGGLGGGPPAVVLPDQPVAVGPAGEIQVRLPPDDTLYLQLFVFAGAVAFAEHGATAAERARAAQPIEGRTIGGASIQAPVAVPLLTRPTSPWQTSPEENALLNRIVLRYTGGDFKAHLEAELGPLRSHPTYQKLVGFILEVRPTQYCARLYKHPPNDALRQGLGDALLQTTAPLLWLERLPLDMQRSVEDLVRARLPGARR